MDELKSTVEKLLALDCLTDFVIDKISYMPINAGFFWNSDGDIEIANIFIGEYIACDRYDELQKNLS